MNYDFIAKCVVPRGKDRRSKKIWLGIGIAALIIAIPIEFTSSKYISLALAVPLVYLIGAFRQTGKPTMGRDVPARLFVNDGMADITIQGTNMVGKKLCSTQYLFRTDAVNSADYLSAASRLTLNISGTINMLADGEAIRTGSVENGNIYIVVAPGTASDIGRLLGREMRFN